MPEPLIISIPQPCHEKWDDMTPVERGRYCASCQKTVTDFTGMTDADIIKAIRTSTANSCGRFFNTQLGRPLQPAVKPSPFKAFINKAAGLLLMLQMAGETSRAQEQKQDTVTTAIADSTHKAESQDTVVKPVKKKRVRKQEEVVYTAGNFSSPEIVTVTSGFITPEFPDTNKTHISWLTADAPKLSVMKRLTNYWMGKRD